VFGFYSFAFRERPLALQDFAQLSIVLWASPGLCLGHLIRPLALDGRHLGVGLGGLPALWPRCDVRSLGLVSVPVLVRVVRLQRADPLAAVQVFATHRVKRRRRRRWRRSGGGGGEERTGGQFACLVEGEDPTHRTSTSFGKLCPNTPNKQTNKQTKKRWEER